jgi:hypothetical protein
MWKKFRCARHQWQRLQRLYLPLLATPKAHFFDLMNEALGQCYMLRDRFAILDIYGEDTTDFRNSIRNDYQYLKYGAAYHPWLETSLSFGYDEETVEIGTHVDQIGGVPGTDLSGKALGADKVKIRYSNPMMPIPGSRSSP